MTNANYIETNRFRFISSIHNWMRSHKFVVCYKGVFSKEITSAILALTEKRLDAQNEEFLIKRKVFGIVVECIQGLCMQQEMDKPSQSLLMLGLDEENYIVHTCNFIPRDKKESLSTLLESINKMNHDELKNLKKSLLASGDHFFQNRNEMSLVDMAKRSGNSIEYELTDVDSQVVFFSLKAKISKNKDFKNYDKPTDI